MFAPLGMDPYSFARFLDTHPFQAKRLGFPRLLLRSARLIASKLGSCFSSRQCPSQLLVLRQSRPGSRPLSSCDTWVIALIPTPVALKKLKEH